MSILNEIKSAWGWTGIQPEQVIIENQFGNLIVKDINDKFWRICPEDVYCEVVAESVDEYNILIKDEEFLEDWFMTAMVDEAEKNLGKLESSKKYYMVIAGILGGEYGGSNVQIAPLKEIINVSGKIGEKIKGMPDGTEIEIKVVP